jgi:hypothetical protein
MIQNQRIVKTREFSKLASPLLSSQLLLRLVKSREKNLKAAIDFSPFLSPENITDNIKALLAMHAESNGTKDEGIHVLLHHHLSL